MQFKQKVVYIALGCMTLLSGVVLLVNVRAQAPQKAQIVFGSDRTGGDFDIYVMDVDGSNVRRLTNDPERDNLPTWSPDGQRIAFSSERDGNAEIYVMDADGSNQRNLTNHPARDVYPDWFDPAFVRLISSVSLAGKLMGTWGWLKQSSE